MEHLSFRVGVCNMICEPQCSAHCLAVAIVRGIENLSALPLRDMFEFKKKTPFNQNRHWLSLYFIFPPIKASLGPTFIHLNAALLFALLLLSPLKYFKRAKMQMIKTKKKKNLGTLH